MQTQDRLGLYSCDGAVEPSEIRGSTFYVVRMQVQMSRKVYGTWHSVSLYTRDVGNGQNLTKKVVLMNLCGNYNLSTLGLIEDSWDHMGLLRDHWDSLSVLYFQS